MNAAERDLSAEFVKHDAAQVKGDKLPFRQAQGPEPAEGEAGATVQTYAKMNKEITRMLRRLGEPFSHYAATRIEELERENAALKDRLAEICRIGVEE